jgi:hypothetical protein
MAGIFGFGPLRTMMDHAAVFDAEETIPFLQKRLRAIEGQKGLHPCARSANQGLQECWCYQAGPNGETLPCPPKPEADS